MFLPSQKKWRWSYYPNMYEKMSARYLQLSRIVPSTPNTSQCHELQSKLSNTNGKMDKDGLCMERCYRKLAWNGNRVLWQSIRQYSSRSQQRLHFKWGGTVTPQRRSDLLCMKLTVSTYSFARLVRSARWSTCRSRSEAGQLKSVHLRQNNMLEIAMYSTTSLGTRSTSPSRNARGMAIAHAPSASLSLHFRSLGSNMSRAANSMLNREGYEKIKALSWSISYIVAKHDMVQLMGRHSLENYLLGRPTITLNIAQKLRSFFRSLRSGKKHIVVFA